MNKKILPLLVAQFLSAFGDNAILFTVIAMVLHTGVQQDWYVPALQSAFLIAFVVLAPWVGGIADHYAKSHVLVFANLIKAVGAGLLLLNVDPLFAYCIVGMGAAVYGPAKYGILPELVEHEALVKANSWVEGSTIPAIILGTVVGAWVADYSTSYALAGTIVLFIISALVALALPPKVHIPVLERKQKLLEHSKIMLFGKQMRLFFISPRSRFTILGCSLFWATAATLRVIIVAWAPLVLMTKNASEIAELTLVLAIGIMAGAALVPGLIPLEHLRRARIPAYLMAVFIVILSFMDSIWPARGALFFIGLMGGMFVVPINAVLQEQGQKSIGSGSAVALQGFFENLAMLIAMGVYGYAASHEVGPVPSMLCLGGLVLAVTFLVSINLPDNEEEQL